MRTKRTPIDGQFEERYRQLFENAPIGIINAALDGTPLIVNERAARVFGYDSPEHFLAEVPSMLDLWVDLGDRHRAAEIMMETGDLRDFEVPMRRRDGSRVVLSVSANPWRDMHGTVIGIQLSGVEVTDRVDAEWRLEEAQAQASIGFWSWRLDTGDLTRSDETFRILGLDTRSTDPIPGILDLVHPDDREVVAMKLATFRRPNDCFEFEFRIETPAGEPKWLIARGRVDEDGLVLSGSVQDITKQKLVEARLKELNDLKTEFVGVVAHDLRSPLTVASGYTEFLRDRWDSMADDERRKFVDNVHRSLDRLGSLVSNVLEVTRLEVGASSSDTGPLDLTELVQSVVTDIGLTLPERTVKLNVGSPLPYVIAGREPMARVVTNLLTNALKYSDPAEPVEVWVNRWGGDVRVAVRDRGVGIAPADHGRLFQRFSRISSNEGPRPEGTGLGLFICRTLVEAWGGSIWVESAVGEGSTFAFTVPTAEVRAETATKAR